MPHSHRSETGNAAQESQTNTSPFIERKRDLSNVDASTKPTGYSKEVDATAAATIAPVQGGSLEQNSDAAGVSGEKSVEAWQVIATSIHSMASDGLFYGSIVQ